MIEIERKRGGERNGIQCPVVKSSYSEEKIFFQERWIERKKGRVGDKKAEAFTFDGFWVWPQKNPLLFGFFVVAERLSFI